MSSDKPHDKFFFKVFSERENAIAEFRSALPARLFDLIDWSSCKLANSRYVDDKLREKFSDLVYEAKIEDLDVELIVLCEHQSSLDCLMQFRVYSYMDEVWKRWVVEHPNAKSLPIIIPIVLSHAAGGWKQSTSMHALFGREHPAFQVAAPHVPSFSFILDDLSRSTDEELQQRAGGMFLHFVWMLMRDIRTPTVLDKLVTSWGPLLSAIRAAPNGKARLDIVIEYLSLASDLIGRQDIIQKLKPVLGNEIEEKIMGYAQQLIEQGRTEGRNEGRTEGRTEGRVGERVEVILELLADNNIVVPRHVRERIAACTDFDTLKQWTRRAKTAKSAEDLFTEA